MIYCLITSVHIKPLRYDFNNFSGLIKISHVLLEVRGLAFKDKTQQQLHRPTFVVWVFVINTNFHLTYMKMCENVAHQCPQANLAYLIK